MSDLDLRRRLQSLDRFLNRELFFVVGLPRSGTTWVQHLLNAHDNILCRGEAHFLDILLPQIQQCFQHYNKEIRLQGGAVAHLKEYGGHVESLEYKLNDIHLILVYCISTIFQKWINAAGDARILGERTPDSIRHLNLLNTLFPRSRIIHVIRDGRDGATSGWFFKLSGVAKNKVVNQDFDNYVCNYLKQWRACITLAQTIGKQLGDRYCEVRYESLLDRPGIEVGKLMRFLGADDEPELIGRCIQSASFENMGDGRPRGEERNTAFVRKGVAGDWKNHFDADLSRQAWGIAGNLLEHLGYAAT